MLGVTSMAIASHEVGVSAVAVGVTAPEATSIVILVNPVFSGGLRGAEWARASEVTLGNGIFTPLS